MFTTQTLEDTFFKALATFQSSPSSDNQNILEKARLELDLFLTQEAEKTLRKTKQAF